MVLHFRTTKKCNIKCDGCSSPYNKEKDFDNSEKNLIKLNNFLKLYHIIIKKNFYFLDIGYAGGEVLNSQNIDYFKKIDNFLINKKWNVVSGIQTNLIYSKEKLNDLMNNYKNFSSSYNFDNSRKYKGKSKIFKDKFKENYIEAYNKGKKISLLVLITNKNVKNMYKIYNIFNKYGIDVGFRYFYPLGNGKDKFDLIPNQDIFPDNLIKINQDKNRIINVEPLDTMNAIVRKEIPYSCTFQNNCTECSLSIENNNKIYTCMEMAEQGVFPISNDMVNINVDNFNILKLRKDNLPEECKKCNVFEYCKGGCMAESYMINKDIYGKTYMCKSWYKVFNFLKKID